MAEAQDTRDWQAGVDAGLVRRLQRPLRRSAAVACAWAREALARAQLGELPLLTSWSLRWGLNEAALAGLRPVVHAISEGSERAEAAPRIAAVAGRPVAASGAAAIVAVARRADALEPGRAMTPGPRGEAGAPGASGSRVVTEVVQGSPAAGSLDLRVDPALLVAPAVSEAAAREVAAQRSATARVNEGHAMPARPRTRPRLVTPMDLAREQADAVRIAATIAAAAAERGAVATERGAVATERGAVATERGAVATERGAVATERGAVATEHVPAPEGSGLPRVAAMEQVEPAAAIVAATSGRPARAMEAPVDGAGTPVVSAAPATPNAAPPIVRGSEPTALLVEASAAIVHTHERSPAPRRVSTPASPGAAPRVRARVLATPIATALLDGPQLAAAARPRVSVPAPTQPGSPELTGLVTAPVGPTSAPAARGDRMDLGLPTAVATSVSPQPAAASSPAPRPVAARVETSQLDIPAIAQAVQRHLERELRWERERRGGRS